MCVRAKMQGSESDLGRIKANDVLRSTGNDVFGVLVVYW
jgi:hypothetical protein